VLQGDPESAQGAPWTYRGSLDGVTFDLRGILLKPTGAGPFGAVIISHGAGGTSVRFLVRWQSRCVDGGWWASPRTTRIPRECPSAHRERRTNPGASDANVLRGHAVREILRTLSYVDQSRVAAHGHSMGAFVTTALVARYPADFRVASHTAGGIKLPGSSSGRLRARRRLARSERRISCTTAISTRLSRLRRTSVLMRFSRGTGVVHEFHVYPGVNHTGWRKIRRSWHAYGRGMRRIRCLEGHLFARLLEKVNTGDFTLPIRGRRMRRTGVCCEA
jgi:dienelactone hydrolase